MRQAMNQAELPSVKNGAPRRQRSAPKEDPPKKVQLTQRTLMIEVPVLEGLDGYASRRVQIDRMTSKQASRLKSIRFALEESGATLANGKPVKSAMHAVLWMLENME